jgi:AcrR family transcriptional regulator
MPRMPRVQDLAPALDADARTRIVDAAERLFAEHGYHAVSLRSIMALAQVNISAAHYYFGSKKNLLQEEPAASGVRPTRQAHQRRAQGAPACLRR